MSEKMAVAQRTRWGRVSADEMRRINEKRSASLKTHFGKMTLEDKRKLLKEKGTFKGHWKWRKELERNPEMRQTYIGKLSQSHLEWWLKASPAQLKDWTERNAKAMRKMWQQMPSEEKQRR